MPRKCPHGPRAPTAVAVTKGSHAEHRDIGPQGSLLPRSQEMGARAPWGEAGFPLMSQLPVQGPQSQAGEAGGACNLALSFLFCKTRILAPAPQTVPSSQLVCGMIPTVRTRKAHWPRTLSHRFFLFSQRSFNTRTLNKSNIPTSTGIQVRSFFWSHRHQGAPSTSFSNLSHLVQGLEVTCPILQMGKTEVWRTNHPRTHSHQVAELPPYTRAVLIPNASALWTPLPCPSG